MSTSTYPPRSIGPAVPVAAVGVPITRLRPVPASHPSLWEPSA